MVADVNPSDETGALPSIDDDEETTRNYKPGIELRPSDPFRIDGCKDENSEPSDGNSNTV
jgi:hypothetical protein